MFGRYEEGCFAVDKRLMLNEVDVWIKEGHEIFFPPYKMVATLGFRDEMDNIKNRKYS